MSAALKPRISESDYRAQTAALSELRTGAFAALAEFQAAGGREWIGWRNADASAFEPEDLDQIGNEEIIFSSHSPESGELAAAMPARFLWDPEGALADLKAKAERYAAARARAESYAHELRQRRREAAERTLVAQLKAKYEGGEQPAVELDLVFNENSDGAPRFEPRGGKAQLIATEPRPRTSFPGTWYPEDYEEAGDE